jgi:CheY-like chemotaxis protein
MTSKTILLVEDDFAIRDVVQDLLEGEGFDVVPAANGKQAIDYLRARGSHPDLVILDLMTPIVTGWQVLEMLRHDPGLSGVPVIVVTATQGNRPTGATELLSKPFRLDDLFDSVHRHLH